jgi:Na+-translocating ferredoxin:NAD+ oxidoreductase subunit B
MSYRIIESCDGCGACVRLCPVNAIQGEKKKLHAIGTSLCIECGACGRICPRESVVDAFGIVCRMFKKSLWEKPRVDAEVCMSCGICVDACPVDCLEMSVVQGRDKHPVAGFRDAKACIGCGFCSRECPVGAIAMKRNE